MLLLCWTDRDNSYAKDLERVRSLHEVALAVSAADRTQPSPESKNNYEGYDNKGYRAEQHVPHVVIFHAAACLRFRPLDLRHGEPRFYRLTLSAAAAVAAASETTQL